MLQLTRESVQTAIVNGITADQILHYIKANAHPDMLKNVSFDEFSNLDSGLKHSGETFCVFVHSNMTLTWDRRIFTSRRPRDLYVTVYDFYFALLCGLHLD